MWILSRRFNFYLVFAIILAAGCKSPEEREQRSKLATLRVHLSARSAKGANTDNVQIAGVSIPVDRKFFLDERGVASAAVVDSPGGGFTMRLELNDHGRMVLEGVTAANINRHILIFCQFGNKQAMDKGAWLAAPLITGRITDGVLVFAPGIPREAAENIAIGLNNVARELSRPLSW